MNRRGDARRQRARLGRVRWRHLDHVHEPWVLRDRGQDPPHRPELARELGHHRGRHVIVRRARRLQKHRLLTLQVQRLPAVPVAPARDVVFDDEPAVHDAAVQRFRALRPRPQSPRLVRGSGPQRREHDGRPALSRADELRGDVGHDEEMHRRPHVLDDVLRGLVVDVQVDVLGPLDAELVVVVRGVDGHVRGDLRRRVDGVEVRRDFAHHDSRDGVDEEPRVAGDGAAAFLERPPEEQHRRDDLLVPEPLSAALRDDVRDGLSKFRLRRGHEVIHDGLDDSKRVLLRLLHARLRRRPLRVPHPGLREQQRGPRAGDVLRPRVDPRRELEALLLGKLPRDPSQVDVVEVLHVDAVDVVVVVPAVALPSLHRPRASARDIQRRPSAGAGRVRVQARQRRLPVVVSQRRRRLLEIRRRVEARTKRCIRGGGHRRRRRRLAAARVRAQA
mmetsp:Transcript_8118/g.29647  ORF Transcript_8118/g.29647 Transcript_8118/m.29647 type:complete len:446 (+) Transcript_8118:1309-2646(+)|eukprot:31343-Pelagococcus_subviridis.AAC.2